MDNHHVASVGQRRNVESPKGFKPMTSQTRRALYPLSYGEVHGQQGHNMLG